MGNSANDPKTFGFIEELFQNSRSCVQTVLNAAFEDNLIERNQAQSFMDRFCQHSYNLERFIRHPENATASEKDFAAVAVLNLVTIALAAGSREPNSTPARLQKVRQKTAAEMRKSTQARRDAKSAIIETEVERWLAKNPKLVKWSGDAIAARIISAINSRLNDAGIEPYDKVPSLGRRVRDYLNSRIANKASGNVSDSLKDIR